jgi:hypothetical protein
MEEDKYSVESQKGLCTITLYWPYGVAFFTSIIRKTLEAFFVPLLKFGPGLFSVTCFQAPQLILIINHSGRLILNLLHRKLLGPGC